MNWIELKWVVSNMDKLSIGLMGAPARTKILFEKFFLLQLYPR